ncbi:hypothetical protein ES708_21318 [subsurface metagenome]
MTHFLKGVRSIGNQLADKDFAVDVQGIDNDIENLFDLGFERSRFIRFFAFPIFHIINLPIQ